MIKIGQDEKIIFEARRHWFVVFPQAVVSLVLALLPIIGYFVLDNFFEIAIDIEGNINALAVFAYCVWVLALWIFFFVQWTDYYLDVWYLTNKRIIDVEQKEIFHREVISLRYEQIQDVTIETSGVIATLLGFGDIHVQTAAVSRKIILGSASNPAKIKKIILDHQGQVTDKPYKLKSSGDLPPEVVEKISN